jgi:hypothetical protein
LNDWLQNLRSGQQRKTTNTNAQSKTHLANQTVLALLMTVFKIIVLALLATAVSAKGPTRQKTGNKDKVSGKGRFEKTPHERFDKDDSEIELDKDADVDFDADMFFGGKGMKNKGKARFSKGKTQFKGRLNSTDKESFMNVSKGARLEFDKPKGGGKHKVGGKGMSCKGRMDLKNKTEVDFDGRLHIGFGGRLNVTKGSKVKFGKPTDGTKHLIEGDGIISNGEIEFSAGETDVSAPILSIGEDAEIITDAGSTISFTNDEIESARRLADGDETTRHQFKGKGARNKGKMKFGKKHKAEVTDLDNEGDLKIDGTDNSEVSAKRFKQRGGNTVVKHGGVLRANGTEPLRFHGGKMRGSGGKYKGNCQLRNKTRLAPGDPDDTTTLGRSKITIEGDLDLAETTFTDIKLLMSEGDSVEITGRAKLGGILNLDISERSVDAQTFTVLTAAGGIEGEYDKCDGCGAGDVISYITTRRLLGGSRQLSDATEVQVTVAGGTDIDSGATGASVSACLLLVPLATMLLAQQL